MGSTLRLGKIAGIDVGIHYSLFFVLLFFSWSLARNFLPGLNSSWSTPTYWAVGFLAALLLFVSVLLHELAHSVVARASGFEVKGITLFLLGGVSNLQAEAKGPRDEFVISAVGPAASLALAGLLFLAYRVIGGEAAPATPFGAVTVPLSVVEAVLLYLWFINLVLGIFNLLPAFPLDGGRTLRAIIWAVTGSLSSATKVAAGSGQAMGVLLILLGVWQVLQGNLWGGLWFAFIGMFLNRSASSARKEMKVETRLRGFGVKDAMRLDPPTIDPDASVSSLVYGPLMQQQSTRAVLVCERGMLIGIISLSDIKGVPQHRLALATVRERMTSAPLWTLKPEDELVHALEMLGEHSINQAPVLEEGRLVGLLSRDTLNKSGHSSIENSTVFGEIIDGPANICGLGIREQEAQDPPGDIPGAHGCSDPVGTDGRAHPSVLSQGGPRPSTI